MIISDVLLTTDLENSVVNVLGRKTQSSRGIKTRLNLHPSVLYSYKCIVSFCEFEAWGFKIEMSIIIRYYFYDDCGNICTTFWFHNHTGNNHKQLFKMRSWNNGMRYVFYYVRMEWQL